MLGLIIMYLNDNMIGGQRNDKLLNTGNIYPFVELTMNNDSINLL